MKNVRLLLVLPLAMACTPTAVNIESTDQGSEPRPTTVADSKHSSPVVPVIGNAIGDPPGAIATEPLPYSEDGRFKQIGKEQAAVVGPEPSMVLLLNDSRRRYDKDDHLNLHRVLAHDPTTDTFLEVGFWTLYYGDPTEEFQAYQDYQRRVLSVSEQFGEWNGYFYTADHNENGIEELIGFQLAGCCFAPEVWEYSDGAFHQVLDVSRLSDNMLAIEIPAPGAFVFYGPNYVTGDYLRFAFEWNSESEIYELAEQDEVTSYPATP